MEEGKRKIRVLVVSILVILVLLAGLFYYWYSNLRAISVDELLQRSFNPGDTVTLEGIVKKIEVLPTNYGNITLISFKSQSNPKAEELFKFTVENNGNYEVGKPYRIKLHFQYFYINGYKLLLPREMFYSFMYSVGAIERVVDASDYVSGVLLESDKSVSDHIRLNVVCLNNISYSLDDVRAYLYKPEYGIDYIKKHYPNSAEDIEKRGFDQRTYLILSDLEYKFVAGNFVSKNIDYIEPLSQMKSKNNTVKFVDANCNGLLDNGDYFDIYINPEKNETTIHTYSLVISSMHKFNSSLNLSQKYIINWYNGAYEVRYDSYLRLIYHKVNATTAKISVGGIAYGISIPMNLKNVSVKCHFSLPKFGEVSWKDISKGEYYDENTGLTIKFYDNNKNNLLDKGDYFVLQGLPNTSCDFSPLFSFIML